MNNGGDLQIELQDTTLSVQEAAGLRAFVATLIILYLGSVFGPPPPSENALAIASLAGWLLVAWAYWIDRHRSPVAAF